MYDPNQSFSYSDIDRDILGWSNPSLEVNPWNYPVYTITKNKKTSITAGSSTGCPVIINVFRLMGTHGRIYYAKKGPMKNGTQYNFTSFHGDFASIGPIGNATNPNITLGIGNTSIPAASQYFYNSGVCTYYQKGNAVNLHLIINIKNTNITYVSSSYTSDSYYVYDSKLV